MWAECSQILNNGYGMAGGLFLLGLIGSATHCTAMCGPFVLAQIGTEPSKSPSGNLLPFYHLGRATTYVLLAVLAGTVFNLVFINPESRGMITAPLLLTATVFFLASAFPALAKIFPWAARGASLLPYSWIQTMAAPLLQRGGHALRQYGLGVILGFLPCGLVLSALMMAMTAPHLWQSALGMGAFAAGTWPSLALIGLAGCSFKSRFPRTLGWITPIIMIFNSFWLVSLAVQSMK